MKRDEYLKNLKEIMELWNSYYLLECKSITTNLKIQFKRALKAIGLQFPTEDPLDILKESIKRYAKVFHSGKYWYDYPYSLYEFLHSGNTQDKGYWMFIKGDTDRFLVKDEKFSPYYSLFKPLTTTYKFIFDRDNNTYFGFPIPDIENYTYKMNDVEWRYKNQKHDLGLLSDIEFVIAGIFYHRNRDDDAIPKLRKWMKYWFNLISELGLRHGKRIGT